MAMPTHLPTCSALVDLVIGVRNKCVNGSFCTSKIKESTSKGREHLGTNLGGRSNFRRGNERHFTVHDNILGG